MSVSYSYRITRATDIALTARIPLEIHSRGWDDLGQSEGYAAFQRGAQVVMNQPAKHSGLDMASVVVAIGRYADSAGAPVAHASQFDIETAGMRMYCREFTPAASELLKRAEDRLELSGRMAETVKLMARAIAGLNEAVAILPEHVAEALSYRRPTSLEV